MSKTKNHIKQKNKIQLFLNPIKESVRYSYHQTSAKGWKEKIAKN